MKQFIAIEDILIFGGGGGALRDPPLEVWSGSLVILAELVEGPVISQLLESHGQYEDLYSANWIKFQGVLYRPGIGVILDVDTESEDPLFGKILYIFFIDGHAKFNVELWQTLYFDRIYYAYCVEKIEPPMLRMDLPGDLSNTQTVHLRHSFKQGNTNHYVTLKHKPW